MTLKELLEKATPLPLELRPTGMIVGNLKGNIRFVAEVRVHSLSKMTEQDRIDGLLLVHARTMLPNVVAALEKAVEVIKGEYPTHQWSEYGVPDMEAVLAEANNPTGLNPKTEGA